MPLTSARHAGFIYISFIAAVWLYCYEAPLTGKTKGLFSILLVIQLIAGLFFAVRDIRLPFSNLYTMKEVLKEVPPHEKLVTDYWTMNAVVAFTDKPVYCIDLQKEMSFVRWTHELTVVLGNPHRYSDGVRHLFEKEGIRSVYLISQNSPGTLYKIDPQLPALFRLTLVDKREGAIESGSNLYLYQISYL
jgi:hypothetical protein